MRGKANIFFPRLRISFTLSRQKLLLFYMTDLETGGEQDALISGGGAVFFKFSSILVIESELQDIGMENCVYGLHDGIF